ncbi:hypothetical protein K9M16_04315 [Candidatus Babeliales bacterium]|nr:hypothetical protein [Candidatus Babeliales bacterium]
MKFFRKFFITLLLLTSLNLTQNFAMEPDPNEDQNLTPEEQIEKEQFDLARKRGRQESDASNKRSRASHDDDDEESDDDSDSVSIVPETPLELQGKKSEQEQIEKKFILECKNMQSKITLKISKDIANQSLMLGSIYKESCESFLDVSQITNPDSIFILHKLMKLANQIAQSQDTVNLRIIINELHNRLNA